jgi:16S rRNA (uracil1498-N3)-methyltransferase
MHRFFVPSDLLLTEEVDLPRQTAQQVVRVLRARSGERVVLFCGDGCEWEAVLEEVTPKSVRARLLERRTPDVELRCRFHAAVAVLKGEKLDWVVQKLTELGASRISLMLTERTVVSAGEERWSRRMERYERITREAAEQCGRVRVPSLHEPRSLARLLSEERDGLRLILDPFCSAPLSAQLGSCPEQVLLLIGPEGGFSPSEVETAREAGVQPVSLGRRVLRAETAAIAAAALVAAADDARESYGH